MNTLVISDKVTSTAVRKCDANGILLQHDLRGTEKKRKTKNQKIETDVVLLIVPIYINLK